MVRFGRHVSKLTGYAPALPTPFNIEGDIDVPAFEHLCDLQLAPAETVSTACEKALLPLLKERATLARERLLQLK